MSAATTSGGSIPSGPKRSRIPAVRSVEAVRWSTLRGKLTAAQRREALRQVAAKMR